MIKTETFAKLFFLVSCTGLLMYVVLAFYTFHTAYTAISQVQKFRDRIQNFRSTDVSYAEDRYRNDLKYILLWPVPNQMQSLKEVGQGIFINYNCTYINCYLTSNKYLLNSDYRNFEAIVFNISVLRTWEENNLPEKRTPKQKYIFYSGESADSSPICNLCAENYFNWTWTYKLNSDIPRPFIEVRDNKNEIVAPRDSVRWITKAPNFHKRSYIQYGNDNKYSKNMKKTVAFTLSKCETKNKRIEFVLKLKNALKQKSLILDIYGCSFLKCPHGNCSRKLKNKYFFYLAYEESFAVDYVTAEVIKAYDIGAVPIVVGGADYHKFLPDGSYVNAHNKSAEKIAAMIEIIIENESTYKSYHSWRKHYVIRESRQFEGICDLCKDLNDQSKFQTRAAYKNFRKWWYSGSLYEKCKLDPDPSEGPREILKESDLASYYNILHPNSASINI